MAGALHCLVAALAGAWLGLPLGALGVQSGQLTAADVDDNLNFDWYLQYKSRRVADQSSSLPNPPLEDRVLVNVTDESGLPFSCAVVEIPELQLELPAGTNGLLALFPSLDGFGSEANIEVRARAPSGNSMNESAAQQLANISGTGGTIITLQIPASSTLPSQLDVAFVVDTTGSMCDEMSYLQAEVLSIFSRVESQVSRSIDTRVATILYKDEGDAYVVSDTPFGPLDDNSAAINKLKQGSCGGGGDYPEAMDQAMGRALQLQWRSGNTARVTFLIADAPPHDEDLQATFQTALNLRKTGVKVYGLAASGVADTAEYLMRLIAVVTGARHLWLTDDSGIGNAHQEPKVLCYQVTRLDQLLERVLRSELDGARVEALPSDILREVGEQENGICMIDFQPTTTGSDGSGGSDVAEGESEGDYARDAASGSSSIMGTAVHAGHFASCSFLAVLLGLLSH